MRIFLISFFILVTPAFAELSWESQEKIVETKLDDRKLSTTFDFKNTGEETVIVLDVKHSCGCTISNLDKTVYEPDESGQIVVHMDLKNLSGEQAKTVSVYTSENPREPYVLYLLTNVPERFSISPAILSWPFRGQSKTRTAVISHHPDLSLDKEMILVEIKDRQSTGVAFMTKIKEGPVPHTIEVEVTPAHLDKIGHAYLSAYAQFNGSRDLIGQVYLLVR